MRINNINANNHYYNTIGDNKSLPNGKNSEQVSFGRQKLIEAIDKISEELRTSNTSLRFSTHEGTNQIMVKIIDNITEEVIKEIPPEKFLDMVTNMMVQAGIIIDKNL